MSFVFKSLIGGLIATLPMAVSVSMMFGLMGYLDITLNITTSLLTCILVGVGVDYTVHFLWHLKDHLSDGDSLDEAIANTFRISGKGILFNGLSVVMGFSAKYKRNENFFTVLFYAVLIGFTFYILLN